MNTYRSQISVVLLALGMVVSSQSRASSVISWTNDSSQTALSVLNGGSSFVTNFIGTNDVTITQLSGNVNSVYMDAFGGASSGNNPSYLTDFVGSSAANTGDGLAGHMKLLETALVADAPTNALQFDFASSLNGNSRIVIADVDLAENYTLAAYHWDGSSYVQLSLSGWTHETFSGKTGASPNSNWAVWDASTGTMTGNSPAPMNEPLDVFTPDQAVDRVVFTKLNQSTAGSAGIQIVQVPEPSGIILIGSGAVVGMLRRKRRSA